MIREEYIEEIKKHILSARIEKVYNADLIVKNNGENSLIFPSFNFKRIFLRVSSANADKTSCNAKLSRSKYFKLFLNRLYCLCC